MHMCFGDLLPNENLLLCFTLVLAYNNLPFHASYFYQCCKKFDPIFYDTEVLKVNMGMGMDGKQSDRVEAKGSAVAGRLVNDVAVHAEQAPAGAVLNDNGISHMIMLLQR
ncbi:hypothetical protein V6N13_008983 [Hibiscus sabdariffa]